MANICTLPTSQLVHAHLHPPQHLPSASSSPARPPVANIGGLMGPMFIGFVVHHTGVYTTAMQGLGVLLACSASLVWSMQKWGLDGR